MSDAKSSTYCSVSVPASQHWLIAAHVNPRRYFNNIYVDNRYPAPWTMAQWQQYFHNAKLRKERGPLNVLSLEISHLRKINSKVIPPLFVRQIDWIDQVCTLHLFFERNVNFVCFRTSAQRHSMVELLRHSMTIL